MWFLFAVLTLIFTIINLYMYMKRQNYSVAMALSLAFISLTLLGEKQLVLNWVRNEDWAALLDVVATSNIFLWLFTIFFILTNILPLFLDAIRKKPKKLS